MSKKYELLSMTALLAHDVKMEILASHVSKLTAGIDLAKYFNTCELTLFLYNCVINADLAMHTPVDNTVSLYRTLFKGANAEATAEATVGANAPARDLFSPDVVAKIRADVAYIQTAKMYTRISTAYHMAHMAYTFFFCPNIYVIEQ